MSSSVNKILLNKEVHISISYKLLNDEIYRLDQKSFYIHRSKEGEFKFVAKRSFGTAIIKGFPNAVDGITVFGKLIKVSDSSTIIIFTTKLRFEHVFTCIIWFGMILLQIFSNEPDLLWVNVILFPIVLVWFWFVYRFQEKKLLGNVERKIRNITIKE